MKSFSIFAILLATAVAPAQVVPAKIMPEAKIIQLMKEVEVQFNNHGIHFDATANREQITKDMERIFDYFTAKEDPDASKRMTYLLSLFQYAQFDKITGDELKKLINDIGNVFDRQAVVLDVGKDVSTSKNVFDMNQLMAVTDYLEMTKTADSFTLILHTKCTSGKERKLSLNTDALPRSAKMKMKAYHFSLSHVEYDPVVKLQIIIRSEIRKYGNTLRELITEKSGMSIHEMTPAAPNYLEAAYTLPGEVTNDDGKKIPGRVVSIESRIENYIRRVESSDDLDIMPLLMKIEGINIMAKFGNAWGYATWAVGVSPWRTVQIRSYAIFPEFLNRTNSYSPIIFYAFNDLWHKVDFTIKIAR